MHKDYQKKVDNDNFKSVNNYYFISPFGKSEINKLTFEDRIKIFSNNDHPLIMIIKNTNLNTSTPEFHNVGYIDDHSIWGYVYDGENWIKDKINNILTELLNSKRDDLIKIYNDIKEFISEDDSVRISCNLDHMKYEIVPLDEKQRGYKRKLFSDTKKKLFDKRNLCLNAIKNSGKPIKMKNNNNYHNILKEGLTFDTIRKIKNKRELIKYILNMMKNDLDYSLYQYILDKINTTINFDSLNKIDGTLLRFCFSNDKLNKKIFDNNINNE